MTTVLKNRLPPHSFPYGRVHSANPSKMAQLHHLQQPPPPSLLCISAPSPTSPRLKATTQDTSTASSATHRNSVGCSPHSPNYPPSLTKKVSLSQHPIPPPPSAASSSTLGSSSKEEKKPHPPPNHLIPQITYAKEWCGLADGLIC